MKYYYQDIWTLPVDLAKGKVKIRNERFFKCLCDVNLDWVLLNNGVPVREGRISDIKVKPGTETEVTIPYGEISDQGEWALNVSYVLKESTGVLPAGYEIAGEQFLLTEPKANDMNIATVAASNQDAPVATVVDNDRHYLIVKGQDFTVEFNRRSGFMTRYEVAGTEYINEGGKLAPNFWRAVTDNDFGADLMRKYAAWKNPEMKLEKLTGESKDGLAYITANYSMPGVQGTLDMTYVVNGNGAVKVTEAFKATKDAKVSDMFRFGMQMQMPESFDAIEYYGRGPIENYSDRNHGTRLGLYRQTVAEQFFPYVRPQETGTKTDIRYWKQLNHAGKGLEFISDAPFSASALDYTVESLDEGLHKRQTHSPEVEKAGFTNLIIDKEQMGLGCVNSWGALPLPQYRLKYGDRTFTFIMKPVK